MQKITVIRVKLILKIKKKFRFLIFYLKSIALQTHVSITLMFF